MISTISADAMRYAKRAHNLVARSNRMLLMTFRLGKKSPITTLPRFHRVAKCNKCGSIRFKKKKKKERKREKRGFVFIRMNGNRVEIYQATLIKSLAIF